MEISVEHEDNYTLAVLRGNFDSSEVDKIRDELLPIVKQDQARLLVDLTDLKYVMSEGLGQFVNLVVEGRNTSSRVVFFAPSTLVDTVIRTANLHRVLELADSLEDAITKMNGPDKS